MSGLVLVVSVTMLAQRAAAPAEAATGAAATARIVAAAQALLASLDADGRAKVQFPFDGPQKTRWSNFPSPMFERRGLRLADLTAPQRAAVTNILTTVLSGDGYRKVSEIMRGDEVMKTAGGGPGGGRGRGGPGGPGGPRGPGGAPSLPAAQPAVYTIDGREIRPLAREHDTAFALIQALDDAQRRQAILPYRVADLVLGPGQDGRRIAMADAALADLDRDGTDTVSAGEAASYAAAVAAAIGLEIDGAPLAVTGKATRVPGVDDVRSGAGAMLIELEATVPALDAGPHLLRSRTRRRPTASPA